MITRFGCLHRPQGVRAAHHPCAGYMPACRLRAPAMGRWIGCVQLWSVTTGAARCPLKYDITTAPHAPGHGLVCVDTMRRKHITPPPVVARTAPTLSPCPPSPNGHPMGAALPSDPTPDPSRPPDPHHCRSTSTSTCRRTCASCSPSSGATSRRRWTWRPSSSPSSPTTFQRWGASTSSSRCRDRTPSQTTWASRWERGWGGGAGAWGCGGVSVLGRI